MTAADVLIWVPRSLLYPVHLVFEYGLRWPLVKLTSLAEKHHLIERTKRLFIYRDGKTIILPTAFVDFGLRPNVGFYFSWDELFASNNKLVLQAGFWGQQWVDVAATDRISVFRNNEGTVSIGGEFLTRPDRPYYGIGSTSRKTDEAFYRIRRVDANVSLHGNLGGMNWAEMEVGYRNVYFSQGQARSVGEVFKEASMPGFGSGYDLIHADLSLRLDTRKRERAFTSGSGVGLEAKGSFDVDPGDTKRNFFTWSLQGDAFWDFSGVNHVISASVYVGFVEATGSKAVPFSELPMLGGDRLRGFLEGRFLGESTFVATVDYRYPVSALFDANIFIELGNVFGKHLKEISFENMHLSWGVGLRAGLTRDASFDVLMAFGSDRLGCLGAGPRDASCGSDSSAVENIRFLFGVNQGF
ncbi:MAG: hypothetical protein KAI47_17670 [Deltaproteobacteria bacterium]|nr:hypothetical protein [Deltaproteobacteria bacterium]